ncbi:zinc-binding alcohol dehydrogenase family protein [Haloferula luteola]
MKAVRFRAGVSILDATVAEEVELPVPVAKGSDLLIKVEAVALNPVDTKVRPKAGAEDMVLGYDAAGQVAAVGAEALGFSVGDRVYYSGDVRRPGSNAEYQLVDSRLVGRAPESMDWAEAAALPLTSLTAWESLFDRLGIDPDGADAGKSILVIGGAGGVGSIGIQLAKHAGLRVVATASRPESASWCRSLGAEEVVDHSGDLEAEMASRGFAEVDFIANFNNTDAYWDTMGRLVAPQGKVVLIVEPTGELPMGGEFKRKSVTIVWEFMFTRSMFETEDLAQQGVILNRIAEAMDAGQLRSTMQEVAGEITAANVIRAHRQIQEGRTIGKRVLAGWSKG